MRACIAALVLSAALPAATLEEAVRDAARRVNNALAPKEAYSLQVRNLSQAPPSEMSAAQRAVIQTLRASGAGDKTAEIAFSLSRNPSTRLVVAEIRRGSESTVLLAPYEADAKPVAALSLERSPLWEQTARILDAEPVETGVLILDGQRIALAASGEIRQQTAVPNGKPWPRDLRGRLHVRGDSFTAFVSDTRCTGTWRPELKASCEQGAADWPLAPGRNHFQLPKLPPAFSLARAERFVVVAGVDGKTRLMTENGATVAELARWGASAASGPKGCAEGTVVVATDASERTLQAFDVSGGEARPLSEPMDSGGVVTELQESAGGFTAVVFQAGTRKHAAYRVTVHCGG